MLTVENLHAGYGDLTIVQGVSFDAPAGQTTAILGHNGVGKTTLLRTIMGLLRPAQGGIRFDGVPLAGMKPHEIAALGIAYIPQEAALFSDLSVLENLRVAFGGRPGFDAALERATAPFDFLRERLQQRAGTLSGGQQKMLLLSRALLVGPKLILADEVTEGVQPMQIGRIRDALRDVNRAAGTTLVIVEQHVRFALELANRYVVMKQGRVAVAGNATAPQARAAIERQLAL